MSSMSQTEIDLIVHADHWDPFRVLGLHELASAERNGTLWAVRSFLPEARQAWVVDLARGEPGTLVPMQRIHPAGFFEAVFSGRTTAFPYRLKVENFENHSWDFADPYRYGPILTDFDLHLLGEGTHYRNYERLGAHVRTHHGISGVHFAVWAPNAQRVSVVGNFNHWDGRRHPMGNRGATGVWELFIPGLCQGEVYKYEVKSRHQGYLVQKSDPYGFAAEMRPKTASIVWDVTRFRWHDDEWIASRPERQVPRPADRGLRSSPGFLEARRLARQRISQLSRPRRAVGRATSTIRTSHTLSSCRSQSIRSTEAGVTSRWATSRRRRGTARPTTSPTSSTPSTSTATA